MRQQKDCNGKLLTKLKNKGGTTLVEMIVTLMLIGIMLSMATASLSSASKVFVKVQKTQYAQSILDTVMTELRSVASDAVTYVKIYEDGKNISRKAGNSKGNAIEFMNSDSFIELITTETDNSSVQMYDSNLEFTGAEETMKPGNIYIRYYSVKSSDQNDITYIYKREGTGSGNLVARAMKAAYGEGFYMGNYVKVTYSVPDGTNAGDEISFVNATVALYSDESCSEASKVAEDTEPLYFRNLVQYRTDKTATSGKLADPN